MSSPRFSVVLPLAGGIYPLILIFKSAEQDETQLSKLKNAMLATVLILSGCPAASLKATGSLDRFVDVVQNALTMDNAPVSSRISDALFVVTNMVF